MGLLFLALCLFGPRPAAAPAQDKEVRIIRGVVQGQSCDGSDAPCAVRIQTSSETTDVIYSMSLPVPGCYFGEEARKAAALRKGERVEIHVPILPTRSDLLCGEKARVIVLP
jgi:hypothetical protein